jgi:hypothetical protein
MSRGRDIADVLTVWRAQTKFIFRIFMQKDVAFFRVQGSYFRAGNSDRLRLGARFLTTK